MFGYMATSVGFVAGGCGGVVMIIFKASGLTNSALVSWLVAILVFSVGIVFAVRDKNYTNVPPTTCVLAYPDMRGLVRVRERLSAKYF